MLRNYDLLVLDYGGVYSFDYDPTSFNKIMLSIFGKQPSKREKEQIFSISQLLGCNSITPNEYVRRVAEILASPVPAISAFEEATTSYGFPPSPAMVKLVQSVRKNGIRVALLSDMYLFELEKTRAEGRYEGFDYTQFSSEVGYMKNNPKAFTKILNHFGVEPEKVLFVDDLLPFVKTAKSLGLNTLWVDKNTIKNAGQLAEIISEQIFKDRP